MALSTKHRTSIYQSLAPIIGEDEADAMLSELPAQEGDALATEELVRAEISGLEARINDEFRQQTVWMAGAMMSGLAAGMGLAAAVGAAMG